MRVGLPLLLLASAALAQRCLPPESSSNMIASRKEDYSMAGKTVVMTGVSIGTIGHGGAVAMAHAGARLIILGRTQSKLDAVKAAIQSSTGRSDKIVHGTIVCDLSSFASIRSAAKSAVALAPKIDVLVNLAGLNFAPTAEVTDADITEDGFEIVMAVDLIGPALLTELLLPSVRAATPTPGRVISIGSATMNILDLGGGAVETSTGKEDRVYFEPPIVDDWCFMCGLRPGCFCIDELDQVARRPAVSTLGTTARSNVVFALTLKTFWTYHLAKREQASGVSAHIFHPGFVWTPGTDVMAHDSGYFNNTADMTKAMCPGMPWFVCDCTDDPAAATYREATCPLSIDEGSASLTFLAAAPADDVAPHNGLLTNACEAGDAIEHYGKYLDQRLNMASKRGELVTEQWGRAAFDLITGWATGAPPSDPDNFAAVKADCRIRGPLGGYTGQLWATLGVLITLVAACNTAGCCHRRGCCCFRPCSSRERHDEVPPLG